MRVRPDRLVLLVPEGFKVPCFHKIRISGCELGIASRVEGLSRARQPPSLYSTWTLLGRICIGPMRSF